MAITTPFTIKLLKFETLEELTAPDLTFGTVDSITDVGPLVYVLIEGGGGIVYVGKSDAKSGAPGKRPRSYATWVAQYRKDPDAATDPIVDPCSHNLAGATNWSPIVRFASHYNLDVRVAAATGGLTGTEWEARIKGLTGIVTGLESVVGASGWELKGNRADGSRGQRRESNHGVRADAPSISVRRQGDAFA